MEIVHVCEPLLLMDEGHEVMRLPHVEDAVWLGLDFASLRDQPVGGGQGGGGHQEQRDQAHPHHRPQHASHTWHNISVTGSHLTYSTTQPA